MLTILFDPYVTGHHMEYIHHAYLGAMKSPEEKFIFYLPLEFEKRKSVYGWDKAENVSFRFFTDQELNRCGRNGVFVNSWNISLLLKAKIKETGADKVLLISFIELLLFISFLLPAKVKVSGIIYSIYLYNINQMSRLRLMAEKARYWIAVRSKCIERILVLNDQSSVTKLNEVYSTDKFRFIPDPVPHINMNDMKNLREELEIPENNRIYLHFGGLAKRKGTLEILKAIAKADSETIAAKTFIIAGKIYDDIKDDFYSMLPEAKEKVQIIVFDKFCPYELLYNLCYTTDVILMPYSLTSLSSGVLGYASLFRKPVIGPSDGLIGKLIEKYHLGVRLENVMADGLLEAILNDFLPSSSTTYAENNSIDRFINVLLDVKG